ncbi:unnamed protein product [Clonostachys solani]|uniref:JmjC domain-containing protein n=1 Tax=Clonostachys solani TaxID=160281 RepID=A0A9N9YZU8_9HYPO|nr:unnamed protein product [Clonostachys solani]
MRQEIARRGDGNDKTSRCGQFARHARLYFPTSLLKAWEIEYTIVAQRAGDVVVTLPGTYHQGFAVGRTKAEVMNYADEKWASSNILWCDSECPEYPIDPHDMRFDVVKAKMPEASIDQRRETHKADEYQLRNENGQEPAITTNLGRSLNPYGAAFVRAFMDNGLELGDVRKVWLFQMIMQCQWPGPGDIIPQSASAISRANRLVSVSTVRRVDQMGDKLPLVMHLELQLRRVHERALVRFARTCGRSADYFRSLLEPGAKFEYMASKLGPHILLTLPTKSVRERGFALRVDNDLLKQPIHASSYYKLEKADVLYFVRHFYDLRPDLRLSQELRLKLQNVIDILGIEQWVRDALWPLEGQEVV